MMRVAAIALFFLGVGAGCGDDEPSGSDGGRDAAQDAISASDASDDARPDGPFSYEVVESSSLSLSGEPEGRWLAGDFHVHATGASNDTGGDSTPEAIKETAVARGLDFLVLTDHSNSTGSDPSTREEDPDLFNMGPEFPYWDKAMELSDETFLMIDGNEISPVAELDDGKEPNVPTGHIGCVPEDLETFDREGAFTDRPRGAVTGGQALAQAEARGCFSILNHPYLTSHTSYDWTSNDYDAMEIWNGTVAYDIFDRMAHKAWLCDHVQGRVVTAVGGSDNHRVMIEAPGGGTDPAIGYPTTAVWAADFSWASIVAGLQAGRTMIYEGDSRLELWAYDDGAQWVGEGPATWLRIRGTVDASAPETTLYLTRATSCQDARPSFTEAVTVDEESIVEQVLESGESFDIAVRVAGRAGVYSARIDGVGNTVHYAALSGAWVNP